MQPIRTVRSIQPVSIHKITHPAYWSNGTTTSYVYDFAQEFAGIVRLQLPPMTEAGTNSP